MQAQLSPEASRTSSLPQLRVSEVVLQTARKEEMNRFYSAITGVDPYLETGMYCFRRVNDAHSQLLVLFFFDSLQDRPVKHLSEGRPEHPFTGLNHIQLKAPNLEAAMDRYLALRELGYLPERCANHGPSTAFYYKDPDGNIVEVNGPNFQTEDEFRSFLETDGYRRHPAGININPDEYIARFKNGEPQAELVKIDYDALDRASNKS